MNRPAISSSARRLDVYRLALEVVTDAAALATQLGRVERDYAAQLRRAAASILLNLAEALRRSGRDRGHLLSIALGSAAETQALLDVARALGTVSDESWRSLDSKLDRVCAMLHRLRG